MIYMAEYHGDEPVGPRTDSGFATLDDVVAMMGEPRVRARRYVVYGDGRDHKVIFSDLPLWGKDHVNARRSSGVAESGA